MRRMQVGALTVAVGALLFSATACATADRVESASTPAKAATSNATASEDVLLGHGRDRTASQTASDWVTYADHLLVVTVVNEIRHAPSRKEAERGEGMMGRTVKLRVDKVLWSAPDAPRPAPAALNLSAAGWVFNNNDDRIGTRRFALEHSSRLEKGHTYIKALEWVDDPCSDDPKKGSWEGLGSGDTIPFDRGVLGAGEFEGKVHTLDQARTKWRTGEAKASGVRDLMVGSSVDKLVADLKTASPRPEKGYGPAECDPSDR